MQEIASADVGTPPTLGAGGTGSRRRDRAGRGTSTCERLDGSGHVIGAGHRGGTALPWPLDSSNSKHRVRHLEPPVDDAAVAPSAPRTNGDVAGTVADAAGRDPAVEASVCSTPSPTPTTSWPSCAPRASMPTASPSAGVAHRPGPDVRSGDLLTHLGAVADGALGAVVLAGGPEVMSARRHRSAGRRARAGRRSSVVVISEAPWWWRLRRRRRRTPIWPRADRWTPIRGCTPFTGSP